MLVPTDGLGDLGRLDDVAVIFEANLNSLTNKTQPHDSDSEHNTDTEGDAFHLPRVGGLTRSPGKSEGENPASGDE